MNKKYLSLILIFASVLLSLFLFGCQNQKIEFYRESKVTNMLNAAAKKQEKIQKSSGMIIYRAGSETKKEGMNFGPRDIEFDLPIKF